MSVHFHIITFRFLYTLPQALSHCRLSHFIIGYFRTFAFYTCPFKNPRSSIGLLIIDSSCTLLSFSRRLAIFTRLTLYLGTRMFDSHFNSQNTHSHFRNSYFTLALLALNALKHFLGRPNRNVFPQFRLPHYTHIRSHTPVFYQHPKPTPLPLIESA